MRGSDDRNVWQAGVEWNVVRERKRERGGERERGVETAIENICEHGHTMDQWLPARSSYLPDAALG